MTVSALKVNHESEISIQLLRGLIRCDMETGKLFWLPRGREFFVSDSIFLAWNSRYANTEAFTAEYKGYRLGSILYKQIPAHRVIFALAHGYWPKGEVDHCNGLRNDNRIDNLREVSNAENRKNQRPRTDNSSGFIGVVWDRSRKKWSARVGLCGKTISLGRFNCLGHAISARKTANHQYGFHENHGRVAS